MNVIVRPENKTDFKQVFEVVKAAFGRENEALLLNHLRMRPDFVPELSLVAVVDGELVGHILFHPVDIEGEQKVKTLCLAPISVRPENQNKGVGSELVKAGLRKAAEMGYSSVIAAGHPRFYPRFGFKKASAWGIKLPFEAPDEASMAVELEPGSLRAANGTVRYPQEYLDCG